MNNKFLFTIIIPVYNTEKYIKKCLESVLKAMNTDCEVIIVNDGSTDNSEKIALEFIKNLPNEYKDNFRYTKKENKGLADTKNVGISLSRGEFISVVDSDDYISDDFYEIARKQIKNGYDIIIYDVYVVFEKDNKLNYTSRACVDYKNEKIVALLNGAISGSSCNKIIKKELYKDYEFPVGKQYEDTAVTPFIISDAEKIKYIPYPMYYYLQREKSIVATNTLEQAFYKICENISEVIKNKGKIEENAYEKYKYVINEFIADRALEYFQNDYRLNKREFNKNIKEFVNKNKLTIKYIIDSKMIYEIENHYSDRQKNALNQIFNYMLNEDLKAINNILSKREKVNYVRNIIYTFKKFLKSFIGK